MLQRMLMTGGGLLLIGAFVLVAVSGDDRPAQSARGPIGVADIAGIGIVAGTAGGPAAAQSDELVARRDSAAPNVPTGPLPTGLPEAIAAQGVPVAVCFAPGTPPEIMTAVNQAVHLSPTGERYFLHGNWGGQPGNTVALTWSFVPDGTTIPPAGSWDNGGQSGGSQLFSRMDTLFGGNRALWISRFQESFDRWEEITGLSYTRITPDGDEWDDGAPWGTYGDDVNRGDIRISMRNIDGGSGILAYDFFPTASDMVIDSSESWGSSSNNHRFLRNVIMHEHGHGLGLEHVCPAIGQRLMEPFVNVSFDGPQHDDLRGGHQNYGDPWENDNSPADATDLGAVAMGAPITVGTVPTPTISTSSILSMDDNDFETEQDWFRFTVPIPDTAVTVSAIPRGFNYDSSSQNSDSSCNSGNIIDSSAVADLDLEFYGPDGTTVLAIGANAPAGSTESLTRVFHVPGDYYARVFPTGFAFGSQLYLLEVTAVEPGACCMADGSCTAMQEADCTFAPGFYTADGTTCPPNPACVPAATLMSCELGSEGAFPDSSVALAVNVEEVNDVKTYQATLVVTRTSGTGTLEVSCPDGVVVDVNRPDFVFADLPEGSFALPGVQCDFLQFAATVLGDASADVGEPKYLGHVILEVSSDAAPGSTFEISIEPSNTMSFLQDSASLPIPTRFSPPCTLMVLDPTDVRAPTPEPGGPNCGVGGPCSGAYEGAECVDGKCYIAKNRYVSIDPTVNVVPVSYQMELVEADEYPSAVGRTWWVDEPDCYDYPNGSIVLPRPATCDGPDRFGWVSGLSAAPVERLWTESPVHVGDCGVVPAAVYAFRASDDGGATLSFSLEIGTTRHPAGDTQSWGDITGGPVPGMPGAWLPPDGATNFGDIGNAIRAFESQTEGTGAPPRVWVDVEINQVVNLADIQFLIGAFEASAYADLPDLQFIGFHPADCP